MQTIVVTGASSGIGAATVRLLLRQGYRVFGTVRSAPGAVSEPHFHPIRLDMEDPASIDTALERIVALLDGQPLAGLVNNAGIGIPAPVAEQSMEEFRAHFQVNVIGLHQLTRGLLPALGVGRPGKAGKGRIVNISSVSGRLALPFTAAYTASKFALEGYSQALRRELLPTGVDVIVVAPGMVQTPIWGKAGDALAGYEKSPSRGPLAKLVAMMSEKAKTADTPETIAGHVLKMLTMRKPPARHAVVAQRFANETLPRMLPQRLVDRMLAKQLGLK
jgi:NAD(P)-dependent dehydrogenase (short-subunit alcohol dehydrogenase family)